MTHQSHHTQLVTFRKFVPHSSPRELLSSYWLLFQIRPVFIGDTEAVQSKWAARLEFAKLKLVERCSDSVGDQAVERWYKRQQLARGCAISDLEIALEDMKKHLVGIGKKWESF